MLIEGSCHCRNIRFSLAWEPDPEVIPARACDCSFCVKHGGLWTSNPRGSLRIRIAHRDQVSKYRFGTATADFHVCSRCGVAPVVTSEVDGHVYAVVSVHALDNVERARIREAPISFEDEKTGDRLARRQRNWIADVAFEPEAART